MARKTKKEIGLSYAEQILSLIPQEQRDTAKSLLSADAILDHLGEAVMRKEDYSAHKDKLREREEEVAAHQANLDNWYAGQLVTLTKGEEALKELAQLKAEGRAPASQADPKPPTVDLSGYLPKDEVYKAINQSRAATEREGAMFMATLNRIGLQHLSDYQEVLDAQKLIEHATKINQPLQAAYSDLFRDKAAERQAALDTKKQSDLEQKIREKLLAEMGQRGPYPISNEGMSPALSGLGVKERSTGIQAATDAYYKGLAGKT